MFARRRPCDPVAESRRSISPTDRRATACCSVAAEGACPCCRGWRNCWATATALTDCHPGTSRPQRSSPGLQPGSCSCRPPHPAPSPARRMVRSHYLLDCRFIFFTNSKGSDTFSYAHLLPQKLHHVIEKAPLFHARWKRNKLFPRRSVKEQLCVYLCEGPPVHVGAADVNMFLVYNPELCVENA